MKAPVLSTGLDVLLAGGREDGGILRGKRIGLLANAASVTSGFVPAPRALLGAGSTCASSSGPSTASGARRRTWRRSRRESPSRLPVVSLYGATFEDLSPRPEHLEGLDVVVSDLPDVGSRYYTFVWTTALMMKACAARGIPVVVLDRPNPLGGEIVEGNLPEDELLSFVGLYPVPGPARDDAGRDRALRERGARPRLRPHGRADAEGGPRADAARDRRDARVGPAVAEHADARDGARLSRRLPRRGHEPLGGARHDAALRDRRRAVARRGRGGRRARTRSACRASSSGRTSSGRRSRSTRERPAAASRRT